MSDSYLSKMCEYQNNEASKDFSITDIDLVVGNRKADIKIAVISDLFCPACIDWFHIEDDLLEKYGSKIAFIHYFYPIDSSCNPYIPGESDYGSCKVTRLFFQLKNDRCFKETLEKYTEISTKYSPSTKYPKIIKLLKRHIESSDCFAKSSSDISYSDALDYHLKKAIDYKITGTPTIIINGRQFEGIPDKNLLETIIEKQLL